ncbi:MAG TPA: acyl-CoA dehydrogenase family protein [Solirubrobacterales bacterium]|nr:acyl-CoA dehydrogenase family protein [Solirubrobacterales bacterium]
MTIDLAVDRTADPAALLEPGSPRLAALLEEIGAESAVRERDRIAPHAQIDLLREARFGALRVPREYGGAGTTLREAFRLIMALAAVDSNVAHILRSHFAFVEQMLRSTDPGQREFWLREAAAGKLVAGAATELGSHKVGAESFGTRLRRDADGTLRLDGVKYYSTGSLYADALLYIALDEDEKLVSVVVPAEREGVTLEDDWDGLGQSLTGTGTTRLENVAVEPREVLVERGADEDGPTKRFGVLQLYITAVIAGAMRNAADDAIALVRGREGRPFAHAAASPTQDPLLQEAVGEMVSAAYAAEATVLRAAEAQDAEAESVVDGEPDAKLADRAALEAAQAKVVVDQLGLAATARLFDLGGASATKRERNLDRHWRNVRTLSTHNPRLHKSQAIGDLAINGTPLPPNWFF